MSDLISIVVPIYNVEKYLLSCLKSIREQTYENIEVLLINDGSTDNSLNICYQFSENDQRFKVFDLENHGVSYARNYGIKMAKGKYIAFIDSDDIVKENYIKSMHDASLKNNSDMVCCGYTRNYEKFLNKKDSEKIQIFSKQKYLYNVFYQKNQTFFCLAPWGKLYKSHVLKNIKYPEGKIYEDVATIIDIVNLSNNIVVKKDILYYYRNTENSITNKKFNNKRLFMNQICEELLDNQKEDVNLRRALISFYFCRNIETLIMLINSNDNNLQEYKNEIKNNLKKYRFKVLFDLNTKVAVKISAIISLLNDDILLKFYKIWKG